MCVCVCKYALYMCIKMWEIVYMYTNVWSCNKYMCIYLCLKVCVQAHTTCACCMFIGVWSRVNICIDTEKLHIGVYMCILCMCEMCTSQ